MISSHMALSIRHKRELFDYYEPCFSRKSLYKSLRTAINCSLVKGTGVAVGYGKSRIGSIVTKTFR